MALRRQKTGNTEKNSFGTTGECGVEQCGFETNSKIKMITTTTTTTITMCRDRSFLLVKIILSFVAKENA